MRPSFLALITQFDMDPTNEEFLDKIVDEYHLLRSEEAVEYLERLIGESPNSESIERAINESLQSESES